MHSTAITFTAFSGEHLLASGEFGSVVEAAKARHDADPEAALLLFDDRDGALVDVDYRGPLPEVRRRLEERLGLASDSGAAGRDAGDTGGEPSPVEAPPTRGRPRMGVVAREVTLLPRQWAWLAAQPGSASVVLRRLVDEARKRHVERDLRRAAQKAAYGFMSTLAGDRPHYEDALRALFAGEHALFSAAIAEWPRDIRRHAERLAAGAFGPAGDPALTPPRPHGPLELDR